MGVAVQQSEIHRYSIEEYHELVASGGLRERSRVELIDGWVVDMSPRSPRHENAVRALTDWLIAELDHARFQLMITGSLTLGRSEPEPDVAVIDRTPPAMSHPASARLVIEVAVSPGDRDLRVKPALYAPYVDEYCVVDLERACVVVHREGSDGVYRDVQLHPRGATLAPQAVAIGELDSDALFAAAFAERR